MSLTRSPLIQVGVNWLMTLCDGTANTINGYARSWRALYPEDVRAHLYGMTEKSPSEDAGDAGMASVRRHQLQSQYLRGLST